MTSSRARGRVRTALHTTVRVLVAVGLALCCILDADVAAVASGGVYVIGPAADAHFQADPVRGGTNNSIATNGGMVTQATNSIKGLRDVCAATQSDSWSGTPTITALAVGVQAGFANSYNAANEQCANNDPVLAAFVYEGCAGCADPLSTGMAWAQAKGYVVTEYDFTPQDDTQGDHGGCTISATASLTLNPADSTVDLLTVRITVKSGDALPVAGWRIDSPVPTIANGEIHYPVTGTGYMGQGDQTSIPNVYLKAFTLSLPSQAPTVTTLGDGSTQQQIYVTALVSRSPDVPACQGVVGVGSTLVTADGGGSGSTGPGDASCSFGFDLLHDVECALCWAFCFDSATLSSDWGNAVTSLKATAPGQVVQTGAGMVNTILTNSSNGACADQGGFCGGVPTTIDGKQVDVLAALSGVAGGDSLMRLASIAVWISVMFIVWRIWRSAFGSKQ